MPGNFKCEIVRLESIYEICAKLAGIIKESGFRIDMAVAVARGGFIPARLLCDFLQIHDLASIQVSHYHAAEKGPEASLRHSLSSDIRGKNVLLVDDVNDTGKSLTVASQHLNSLGPGAMKIAVMHEKRGSSLKADFYAEFLDEWKWLIYEWAVVEDVGSFIKKSGLTAAREILQMLKISYGIDWSIKDLMRLSPYISEQIDFG